MHESGGPPGDIAREYLRVSHDASGTLRSTDEQHDENAERARQEGWTLGTPYLEDAAISASRHSKRARPGFASLMADLTAGRFGARILLLWESSRASRRVGEWVALVDACEDQGVLIHVTTHGRTYDPARARDRRTLLEDAVDSEYEPSKTRDRIKRSLAANVRDGKPHGRIPYGYRREYRLTPQGARIVEGQFPDPVTGPVVREIFDAISAGYSLRSIAIRLNDRGVLSPGGTEWQQGVIRRIALNPVYAGLRSHNGEISDAGWEAIVSKEQYYWIRDLLKDPARRTWRPGRTRHLLSHLARCGVCGGFLHARSYNSFPEYWCQAGHHAWVSEADLDEYVTVLVIRWLCRPGQLDRMADAGPGRAVQDARDELAALRARHDEMVTAMAAGEMSVAAFTTAEPKVLERQESARRSLAALQVPPSVLALAGDARPDEEGARMAWEDATIAARREVIRWCLKSVTLHRMPYWEQGKHTMVTLAAIAPDGTVVRQRASVPFRWAGLRKAEAGQWQIVARGMTPSLDTAHRYARKSGDPADWVVVPLVNDSLLPERVALEWRREADVGQQL